MESHPKVMTVSYGTFSCTLEGFDDPFTTMQLVAEYFRKLASGDRYFGGEPLQPDHNALHQIAKEANPYKVDAEITDTGITLRKANVVDAAQKSEPVAPQNDAPSDIPVSAEKTADEKIAAPLFSSTRTKSAVVVEAPADVDIDDSISIDAETASFVEAAVFSSRRGHLEAAPSEPDVPASELLRQEDEEDDIADQISASLSSVLDVSSSQVSADVPVDETSVNIEGIEFDVADIGEAENTSIETADDDTDSAEPTLQNSIEVEAEVDVETPAAFVSTEDTKAKNEILREEEALERLLETTNTKLQNPDHTRRSNALERLKAAVAATEAERQIRSGGPRTERPKVQDIKVSPSEFREKIGDVRRDHEEMVKITRPVSKSNTKRARGSIATLILGSDQRVSSAEAEGAAASVKKPDTKSEDGAANSRPALKPALKIVRPGDEESDAPASGFDAFAKKIGANTLHELLEASAAYLSIVEEEPRFTQNRIISNLGNYLSENNITEDAASRSLNRLMRDGRILRVKQDSYTISKSARHGFKDRLAG